MSYIKQNESGGGGDTYTLKAAQSGPDVDIQLDAAAGADSDVKLKAGTNITLTEASDTITIDAASGGSPGGSNTQVQFNDGGSFGGDAVFTFDKTGGAEQVVVEGSSTADLLRVTQTGSGNAIVVEDATNPDPTRFAVSANGDVGIGTAPNPSYDLFVLGDTRINGFTQTNQVQTTSGGSAAAARFTRQIDTNTGMYFPGSDEVAFTTAGSERLRIASAGQIGIAGANYGAAGQVLTSGGSGAAPNWATPTAVTPVPKSVGTGILVCDPYTFTAGLESNYPLWANINNTNSSAWSGFPSTTQATFMPFQVPTSGTLAELCFRTQNITSGGTFQLGVYASSPVTNLPLGSPLFTTSIVLSSSTEFEFAVSGVSGLVPGDILYICWLGYTGINGDSMSVGFSSTTGAGSGGYALNFPRRMTGSNLTQFVGRQHTAVRLDGITAGVFPTSIPASQGWSETIIINTPLNMSARYS